MVLNMLKLLNFMFFVGSELLLLRIYGPQLLEFILSLFALLQNLLNFVPDIRDSPMVLSSLLMKILNLISEPLNNNILALFRNLLSINFPDMLIVSYSKLIFNFQKL